ncbi:MAG: hypothetical protein KGH54_00295 [Candidatus Micrarchaeota archaeon]|nr:hypothetical protein [Candidatus Micrarchaeota archaeon]
MKSFKIQSAMEYLMTYGWAILIIAVVLGALFSLGIFNSGSLLGTSCVAAPGFLCQNPVLGTNGNLSVTIGQSTGSTFYNIGLGCASTATAAGLPNPTGSLVQIATSGAANTLPANQANANAALTASILQQVSGQTTSISALKCFGTNANAITGPSIGTTFSGGLWMNYTISSGAAGGSNPMLTQKIASLTLKVV